MDVDAILGVGGDVVYGGFEPRVEGIVHVLYNIKKIKKNVGGRGRDNI